MCIKFGGRGAKGAGEKQRFNLECVKNSARIFTNNSVLTEYFQKGNYIFLLMCLTILLTLYFRKQLTITLGMLLQQYITLSANNE